MARGAPPSGMLSKRRDGDRVAVSAPAQGRVRNGRPGRMSGRRRAGGGLPYIAINGTTRTNL